MEDIEGRVAVVTGAASGIGLGIAEALTEAGAKVMLVDVDGARLEREASRLSDAGADVDTAVVDVGDAAAVEALAERTVDRFGAVHIVVNNAGIVRPGRTWELPVEQWEAVLRVNLLGVVHGVHAFVPRFLASGEPGHVVNMGSMASVVPVPGIGPYNAAKHGVLALTEALAAELAAAGAPVGVTIVMPGRVPSRLGRPNEAPDDAEPRPLDAGEVDPLEVGRMVVDAIRTNRLHLFTHPERRDEVVARFARITDAFGA